MTALGGVLQGWREAMWRWREMGDVSGLAEEAARMDPYWRREMLDMLPGGLRNDVAGLLRKKAAATKPVRSLAA